MWQHHPSTATLMNYQHVHFWNKQFVSHPIQLAQCRCPSLGLSAGRWPHSNTTQNPPVIPLWSPGTRFDSSAQSSAWMTSGWAAFPTSFWTTGPHTWGIQLWNDRIGLPSHPRITLREGGYCLTLSPSGVAVRAKDRAINTTCHTRNF